MDMAVQCYDNGLYAMSIWAFINGELENVLRWVTYGQQRLRGRHDKANNGRNKNDTYANISAFLQFPLKIIARTLYIVLTI